MAEHPDGTVELVLRLSPGVEQTLLAAAHAAHRTVSEFIIESALVRTEEPLAGRTRFGLDAGRWRDFSRPWSPRRATCPAWPPDAGTGRLRGRSVRQLTALDGVAGRGPSPAVGRP